MISVTNSDIREFCFDSERDDYYYKDNGERVPDKLRKGYNLTVFKRSSHNPDAPIVTTDELINDMKELKIKVTVS